MLPTLKQSALRISARLGLSTLISASSWRRDRLLVLCYHGVSLHDEHEWNPALFVSRATLEARFELLRRSGCTVLPLGEAVARLQSGDLPARAVVLTFDDGYVDFPRHVFPLLEQYGYPATVYLTTQRVEHNRPVVRLMLAYLLWKQRATILDARDLPGLGDRALSLATPQQRAAIGDRLDAEWRRLGLQPQAKDDAVRQVAARLGLSYDDLAATRLLTLMNPAEVREMSERGVDIQLHTHRHRTPEDPERFAEELRTNRERIEAITGVRPTHFCYPSGVYRPSYFAALRTAGVVTATTCERGLATIDANPLLIPRFVDTDHTSALEFSAWVSGAAEWLPRRVRRGGLAAEQRVTVPSPSPAP